MDVRHAVTADAMALRPVETTVAPTGIAAMGVPADRPPMVSDRAPVVTASLAKVAKTTTCAKDARASSAKAARTVSVATAARNNAKAGRRNRRHRVPLVNRRSASPRKTSSKSMQRLPPPMLPKPHRARWRAPTSSAKAVAVVAAVVAVAVVIVPSGHRARRLHP